MSPLSPPLLLRALPACLVLCFAGLLQAGEIREFKDLKGRPLKGELLKMRGPSVMIRQESGQETPVPFKQFSREDQTHILNWVATEPLALDYSFAVKEEDRILESTIVRNSYERIGSTTRNYLITVTNRSQNTVEGLRVAYRTFLEDRVTDTGAYYNTNGRPKVVFKSGLVEMAPLGTNHSHKFNTKTFNLDKVSASYFSNTSNARDRLRGIWLRFYRGGVMVFEWKSQSAPKTEWPASPEENKILEEDKKKLETLVVSLQAKEKSGEQAAPGEIAKLFAPATPQKAEKVAAAVVDDSTPEELKIFEMEDTVKK